MNNPLYYQVKDGYPVPPCQGFQKGALGKHTFRSLITQIFKKKTAGLPAGRQGFLDFFSNF